MKELGLPTSFAETQALFAEIDTDGDHGRRPDPRRVGPDAPSRRVDRRASVGPPGGRGWPSHFPVSSRIPLPASWLPPRLGVRGVWGGGGGWRPRERRPGGTGTMEEEEFVAHYVARGAPHETPGPVAVQ